MKKRIIRNKKICICILCAALYSASFLFVDWRKPGESGVDPRLAALIEALPKSLRARTKTADCRVQGPLPDPECTPGAIFAEATRERVCQAGYTATVRKVPDSLKKKVFKEYGISATQPFGSYEIDHFIPLAIGGSNDIANLFPEAADPFPGFHEKDLVENYLQHEVCLGHIEIGAAQRVIAADWVKVYETIPPDMLDALAAKYKSWAKK